MKKSFALSCLFLLMGLAGTANLVLADSSDYSGMRMKRLSNRTPVSVVTEPSIGSEVRAEEIVKEEILRDEVLKSGAGANETGGRTHEVRKEKVTESVTESEKITKSANETDSGEEIDREDETVLIDSVRETETNDGMEEETADPMLENGENDGISACCAPACSPCCGHDGWNGHRGYRSVYRHAWRYGCCRPKIERTCCDPCMTECCPQTSCCEACSCDQRCVRVPRCRLFRKHFWRARCCSSWNSASACDPCCTESESMNCVSNDSDCTESESINCVTSCTPCCETSGTTCVTVRRHCGIFCRRALRQARWTMPYRAAYPTYASYSNYGSWNRFGSYGYGNSWSGNSWAPVGGSTYQTSDCGCGN